MVVKVKSKNIAGKEALRKKVTSTIMSFGLWHWISMGPTWFVPGCDEYKKFIQTNIRTRRCTTVRNSNDQAIPLELAWHQFAFYQHQQHQHISSLIGSEASAHQYLNSISTSVSSTASAASTASAHQRLSSTSTSAASSVSMNQQHQRINSISTLAASAHQ